MNLNEFAKSITKEEGLKESISNAQVKEVLRIFGQKIAKMNEVDRCMFVAKLVEKYK